MKYGQGSHQFVNVYVYVRSVSRLGEYQCLLQASSCNHACAVCVRHQTNKNSWTFPEHFVQ